MSLADNLLSQIQKSIPAPFLFLGSGFSRRYLQAETWNDLLRRFAIPAGKDFNYYFSKANGHIPSVGRLIAADFHEIWWHDPRYESSRSAFGASANNISSPLKYEIACYLRKKPMTNDPVLLKELDVLKAATIDGIITTNWDQGLELIFPDYTVFKGQDELLFANPQSVAEIYKIHGCCSQPNTLVLTDDDYNGFNQRNAYLAAKLLTIFIEHPVIFLGYSISDENVANILGSIVACLKDENLKTLTDRLIFIQYVASPSKSSDELQPSFLGINGKQVPLTVAQTDSYLPVAQALAATKRRFPASMFRRVKNHVYDLVLSNDPHEQMFVVNLANDTDASKVEVVYGVGITPHLGATGYDPIKTDQVMRDVAFNETNFDADLLIQKTLPSLLRSTRYVPVFRYLRRAGYFTDSTKMLSTLDLRVQAAAQATRNNFLPPQAYIKKKTEIHRHNCGIDGLIKHFDLEHLAIFLPYLEPPLLTVESLGKFIRDNYDALNVKGGTALNSLKKLVCLYDLMAFGPEADK